MDEIVEFRRELHQFPELSGCEEATARRIIDKIQAFQPDELHTAIGGNGIIASFFGKTEGPELLFRSELDALPIEETNDFDYQSRNHGIAHKCGHDGHMAILVGLAKQLCNNPIHRGRVHLLFQPAEETGEGASMMLEDAKFPPIHPDYAFALHNLPGYPKHQVLCKAGTFTPAVRSLIISLYGKTAHAAEPENGINPSMAIAKMINSTANLNQVNPTDEDFFLITPVHILVGEKAYGVSAGYGELHLTIRCWSNEKMQRFSDQLLSKFQEIARSEGLLLQTEWTNNFAANDNNRMAVDQIRDAVTQLGITYREMSAPLKWGEDFGCFTQQYPGAMFGLGAGIDTPALHNPDYDFPDELIATGVSIFNTIVGRFLR